jgi:16S rRNA (adenine1518-N6/adenine1519-N6)-dimethyltransferase
MSSNGLRELRDDLAKLEIKLKRSLGQNFCHDPVVIQRIAKVCNVKPSDWILEIGAGTGYLTSSLAETAHNVTAVEIDTDLRPLMLKTTNDIPNIRIIFADILELNMATFKPSIIIGNLPYYCSSAILRQWANQTPEVPAFFMLPDDVVNHLKAKPGEPAYTAFSVFAQYAFTHKILFDVHPSSFFPRPNVGSTFVQFDKSPQPRLPKEVEDHFIRVVEGSFMLRRKTILNSLTGAGFDGQDVINAMNFLGLPTTIRGETLNFEQFKRLAGYISD